MLSVHFFTLRAAFFAFDISCDTGWKLRSHAERMAAYGVPHPSLRSSPASRSSSQESAGCCSWRLFEHQAQLRQEDEEKGHERHADHERKRAREDIAQSDALVVERRLDHVD